MKSRNFKKKTGIVDTTSVLQHSFSACEEEFFKLLFFDARTNVVITTQLIENISKVVMQVFSNIKIEEGLISIGFRPMTEKDSQFTLLNFLTVFIKYTHLLMANFSLEINFKIVLQRNKLLIGIFKIFYEHLYIESMSINFENYLIETFYNSTLTGFDPDITLQNYENEALNVALYNSYSITRLEVLLKAYLNFYQKNCLIFDFIPSHKAYDGEKKIVECTESIVQKYIKSTTPSNADYFAIMICTVMLGLSLGQIITSPLVTIGMFFLYKAACYSDMHLLTKRIMNANFQNSYAGQIDTIMSQLDGTFFQLSTNYKSHLLSLSKYEQAHEVALLKIRHMNTDLRFVEFKSQKNQKIGHIVDYPSIDVDKIKPILVLASYGLNSSSKEYSQHNLRKYYPFKQDTIPQKKLPLVQTTLPKNIPNYRLFSHQKGSLVEKNNSIIFFDIQNIQDKIKPDIKTKIQNNEFSFGSSKGQFGIFKCISRNQYRLKLFDGTRIDFAREENNTAIDGNHSIPHYVAYQVQKK